MDLDLKLAARRGYLVAPVHGLGTVDIVAGVLLRYDPALPREVRAPLVVEKTRPAT